MAALLVGLGVTIAGVVLFEGLQAILEEVVGDPEADVQLALQRLSERNQRRALDLEAGEQLGIEEIDRNFARLNRIPQRALAESALADLPQPRQGGRGPVDLLEMVSQRMGVSPQDLSRVSAPARMGDPSELFRAAGQSPPGGTVAPPPQVPQGPSQVPQQGPPVQ